MSKADAYTEAWVKYYRNKNAGDKTCSQTVYNLQGQRVSQPIKGYLYITNGRKVVQR